MPQDTILYHFYDLIRRLLAFTDPVPPTEPDDNMGTAPKSLSLDVIVVGAGISGLATAVGLRRAGHHVTVYEKYAVNADSGAGIVVSANANRVLSQWGLDLNTVGAIDYKKGMMVNGLTCTVMNKMSVPPGQMMTTRSDLRNLIKQEAEVQTNDTSEGSITFVYGKEIIDYDVARAAVYFGDGDWRQADLVVACDGIKSKAALHIIGEHCPAKPTGYSAFRLLIPSETLEPVMQKYMTHEHIRNKFTKGEGISWISTEAPDRIFVWWPCRFDQVHAIDINIPDNARYAGSEEWHARCDKSVLREEFGHWHPLYRDILEHASEPLLWKLFSRDPVETMYKGQTCILGDALHPMSPYRAQGASQAIEDGAVLEMCFQRIQDRSEIPARLQLLQQLRVPRYATIQLASTVRQSNPDFHERFAEVLHQCRKWFKGKDTSHLSNYEAFKKWMTGYDARAAAREALDDLLANRNSFNEHKRRRTSINERPRVVLGVRANEIRASAS